MWIIIFIILAILAMAVGDVGPITDFIKVLVFMTLAAVALYPITKYFDKKSAEHENEIKTEGLPDYHNGYEYELFVAAFLKKEGFKNVEVTPRSGDFGADILCTDSKGTKIAVQCKLYNTPVGYKAVEEAVSGMHYYKCKVAVVVTNNTFTRQAEEAAERMGVHLIPRVGR